MLKRAFKKHSHNLLLKQLAGFGRAINRLYENRNHDIYSNGELTVIKKIARLAPKIIVDGGANTGNYSQLLIHYMPNAEIYAFEPVPQTFQVLQEKISTQEHFFPFNKGLFKENTQQQIHLFKSDKHSSIFNIEGLKDSSNEQINIDLVAGDSFFGEKGIEQIDLLKLDVEGAEFDALLGFKKMIKEGRIRAIQFEYGYINITTKNLLIDFYRFFEENGYAVGKIFPKTVEFRPYEYKYEDFLGPNFIAVKKKDLDLIKLLSNK